MNNVILDTSYVVGIIDEKDTWHSRAKGIEDKLIQNRTQFVFLDCVMNEVVNVIVRRFSERKRKKEIASSIQKVVSTFPADSITWIYPEVQRLFSSIISLVVKINGLLIFHDAGIVQLQGEAYV